MFLVEDAEALQKGIGPFFIILDLVVKAKAFKVFRDREDVGEACVCARKRDRLEHFRAVFGKFFAKIENRARGCGKSSKEHLDGRRFPRSVWA